MLTGSSSRNTHSLPSMLKLHTSLLPVNGRVHSLQPRISKHQRTSKLRHNTTFQALSNSSNQQCEGSHLGADNMAFGGQRHTHGGCPHKHSTTLLGQSMRNKVVSGTRIQQSSGLYPVCSHRQLQQCSSVAAKCPSLRQTLGERQLFGSSRCSRSLGQFPCGGAGREEAAAGASQDCAESAACMVAAEPRTFGRPCLAQQSDSLWPTLPQ